MKGGKLAKGGKELPLPCKFAISVAGPEMFTFPVEVAFKVPIVLSDDPARFMFSFIEALMSLPLPELKVSDPPVAPVALINPVPT